MMRTKTFMVPVLALALLASACGGEKKKAGKIGGIDVSEALEAVEKRRKDDPNASGGNTCLLAYQDKYDQLLTEELVLEATGFDDSKMKVKYSKVMGPEHHNVNYTFDHQRVRERNGYTLPFKDNVQLAEIKAMSLAQFNDTYRAMTKEEDEAVEQVVDDVLGGEIDDPDAKKALDNLEKQGVDKETAKETTAILQDAFKKVAAGYRKIPDVGDAAVWNVETLELVVLDNGVQFELTVDVKDTNDENKVTAIALAKKLMEGCK